jgi:hypothetical protein
MAKGAVVECTVALDVLKSALSIEAIATRSVLR